MRKSIRMTGQMSGRRVAQPATPDVFWDWFAEHASALQDDFTALSQPPRNMTGADEATFMALAERMLTDLSTAIHQFDRRIHPFGGLARDGVIDLIFTAEGKQHVFPRVFELVAAAPELPGWRFIPLKPAQDTTGVQADDRRMDFDDVSFLISRDDDETTLLLLIDADVEGDPDTYHFMAHLAAEAQLGEYGYATHLDTVMIANLGDVDPDWQDDMQPIRLLADAFPKDLPN